MQLSRPVGREAASRKYDILSALSAHALMQDKHVQRQALRLMALITARYNWQRDELSIGQEEIARLWSVDERTVKREMARLRAQGWLVLKRAGARGRVSVHGLDLDRLMADTRPAWERIGADFVARLEPGTATPETASNVVPLRPMPRAAEAGEGLWATVQQRLQAADAVTYGAWFHGLTEIGVTEGCLSLAAPSRFHASYVTTHLAARLLAAARLADPALSSVRITG